MQWEVANPVSMRITEANIIALNQRVQLAQLAPQDTDAAAQLQEMEKMVSQLIADLHAARIGPADNSSLAPTYAASWTNETCRRMSCALIATMTVLKLMKMAPTAGESRIPQGARMPAASGSATTL